MRPLLLAAVLATGLPQAKIDGIDKLVTAFISANEIPGLSIAVVADGEVTWSKAYGLADVENHVAARVDTHYQAASIGKTMTATAAMALVDAGKLTLDADIRDYCPAFPQKQWRVTPWNLLTHTSGIRHYGGPNDQAENNSTTHYESVVAALEPFKNDPLQFEPGTKHQYSTYGFNVLGCVVEGAAGVPFLSAMRKYVWDPAGMAATRDDDPAAIIENRARKYRRRDGVLQNAPLVDMSNRLAGGAYLTTAPDLAKFAAALVSGKLVRPETLKRMLTPAKLANGQSVDYGLGFGVEIEDWHDDRWAFHGGSTPGASGMLALMPNHRFAVVFLTNLEDLKGRSELVEDIARLVLDFKPRQP
jgi:serine beta-lactamase-like protein LACTB